MPRYVRLLVVATLIVSLFSGISLGQKDPVRDFCRRFGHQTTVIDRKLYIDGGFVNYNPLSSNPTNFSNQFLSYQDLDVVGSAGMPQLYANLSKNSTVPSVNGGILWGDDVNKKFYLFGGENSQAAPTGPLALYSYDTLNNYWETLSVGSPSAPIQAVSYGAGVSIPERGEAYYYGGWLSNNSAYSWTGPRTATGGLVKWTMDTNQWSNNTGPDSIKRAEGVMVYLPISDAGMLVYFGGIQDQGNGTVGQPMDQIMVYDIASSKWYQQAASGDVPEMRARFCGGATWAPDESSYNIYIYGGAGMPPNTAGFDDAYILSLPSFTWIKMYPPAGSTVNQNPHNTLTCNVIDGSQMIIIGGTFPLSQACDNPDQFGSHNLDMGKQNPSNNPWYLYRQNLTSYVVPDNITAAVGGGPQGGATKTTPDGGFDSDDLGILVTRRYTASGRQPTRDVSPGGGGSSGLSTGAIIGIAVGCGVAGILLLAGCSFCIAKRRHRYAKPGVGSPLSPGGPHSQAPYSPDMASPWSPQSGSPSHHTPNMGAATPASPLYAPFPGGGQHNQGVALQQPSRPSPAELAGDEASHEIMTSQTVADPSAAAKYDNGDGMGTWGSRVDAHTPASYFSGGGFGPSELDSAGVAGHAIGVDDGSPRHQTYYHR